MDLTLTDAEQRFRDQLRHWLDENHPGPAPTGDEAGFEHRRAWQRRLADAGWAGLSWPAAYGGRGATLVEQAIFTQELARVRAPAMANVLGVAMAGPTIIAHGNDHQRRRFLPAILTGEEIWCQGFSEPGAGSDLASLRTRAVRDVDGWTISGQKVWTTFGHHAKRCMLLARTGSADQRHRGLTWFAMDMDQPGVELRPLRQITGEAEFNELFLHDVEVPDENVVGGIGNGWAVAQTTLMHERATMAFGLQIELEAALAELAELIRQQGYSADAAVRQRYATLVIDVEALRLNAYRSLDQAARTGVPGPEGSLGKWLWADVNQRLTELAIDVTGPAALAEDPVWTYRFLRSRANSIEGGTTEVLKNIVAERVLGLPRSR